MAGEEKILPWVLTFHFTFSKWLNRGEAYGQEHDRCSFVGFLCEAGGAQSQEDIAQPDGGKSEMHRIRLKMKVVDSPKLMPVMGPSASGMCYDARQSG
jgi:hypothetical protein